MSVLKEFDQHKYSLASKANSLRESGGKCVVRRDVLEK